MLSFLVGIIISVGCGYAVFSKHIDDGFIGRHILTFASISGLGFAYSGEPRALLTAYVLLIFLILWLQFRKIWRMSNAKLG